MRKLLTSLTAAVAIAMSVSSFAEVISIGDWDYDAGLNQEKTEVHFITITRTKELGLWCAWGRHGDTRAWLSFKSPTPIGQPNDAVDISFGIDDGDTLNTIGAMVTQQVGLITDPKLNELLKQMKDGKTAKIQIRGPLGTSNLVVGIDGFRQAGAGAMRQCNLD